MYCDKHKQILNEMNHVYHYMRSLNITEELISKTKDHVNITMLLWRKLNLPVIPSYHLFYNHIVHQRENNMRGSAEKSEDNVKRGHQDSKRSEKIYCGLTYFQQYQISQLKIMT